MRPQRRRAGIRDRPDPEGCSLDVDQADDLIREANEIVEQARSLLRDELISVAGLLRQPALWSLLEQGRKERFIAEVLATTDAEALANLLAAHLPDVPSGGLLAKFLKRVVVGRSGWRISGRRSPWSRGARSSVVGEFRRFLEEAVGRGARTSRILDLQP